MTEMINRELGCAEHSAPAPGPTTWSVAEAPGRSADLSQMASVEGVKRWRGGRSAAGWGTLSTAPLGFPGRVQSARRARARLLRCPRDMQPMTIDGVVVVCADDV
jgi:hypothetical protein